MIYVTSDLHGYSLEKFKAFLEKIGFSDNDLLYILGDVIDRGADGIKILRWIIRQRNVRLIFGNHESMLLSNSHLFDGDTADAIERLTGTRLNNFNNWVLNSGQVTLNALSAVRSSEIRYIMDYLREVPFYEALSVGDRKFILVHSGLGNFSKDKKLSEYTSNELIWTRPAKNTRYFDDITVIFGHTPTVFYGEEHKGKFLFTDTWIDVDVGVGLGEQPALLRLDDMKELYCDL